jgi:uncharacterized membrane protein
MSASAAAASTLPPTPSFNANIPIISSAGGTTAAYKDPNSPESIMKATTLLQAQSAVDSTYDVDVSKIEKDKKKEGFRGVLRKKRRNDSRILYLFILFILAILFFRRKTIGLQSKTWLLILAVALIVITMFLLQNGR